jgi:hypothetical protein
VAANNSSFPPPIGVPKSDIFRFDMGEYERLRSKWKLSGWTDVGDRDQ